MSVSHVQTAGDPVGTHRVLEPAGVLPQAAARLDTRREIWPDVVRVGVERHNLDAASYRQIEVTHTVGVTVDGAAIRAEVLDIVATRG
jgi:L-erythro-3,5-diaminohexanoate dehydrogenase